MTKLRRIAFTVFMFLPLIYAQLGTVSFNLRDTQEAFFQYLVILIAACFIGNVWLSGFLALNVGLYIWNGQEVGYGQVLNIFLGCLLFLFSRNFFKQEKLSDYYRYIGFVAAISLFWMVFQRFSIDPIFQGQSNSGELFGTPFNDPVGLFGIKMASGIFLTIILPIIASMNLFIGALLLYPIWMSASSFVFLTAGIVSLFYTFHLHKKLFIWLMIGFAFAIPFYIYKDVKTDPKTAGSRFPIWHSAISAELKSPDGFCGLIGYGPDSYRNFTKHKSFRFVGDNHYNHGILTVMPDGKQMFKYYSVHNDKAEIEALTKKIDETTVPKGKMDDWDNPHNAYVNLFFQYGWIGVILLCGLVREMWARFRLSIKDKELVVITSCLIVYFITSIGHFPLEMARLGYLFPILLGAFYARTDA